MMWLLWALVRLEGRAPQHDAGEAADLEAVRRMAHGDADALAELYDRRARALYSLALRILTEPREAEEVVQDVFTQAWKQADRYEPSRGAVVAWLLMMARSRAIDRVRARRGQPALAYDPDHVFGLLADAGDGPERTVLTSERAARLRTALGGLPLLQRVPIELAFYEGLTHTEIADKLEVPLGTIKTRIRLGLLKLKDVFLGGGE
jgi:RNA polymerase sigma-70 factor, ECF subfamily